MAEPVVGVPNSDGRPAGVVGAGFVHGYSRYEDGKYHWIRCYWEHQDHLSAELTDDEIEHMKGWLRLVINICEQRIAAYSGDRADLQEDLTRATTEYDREELRLQIQMVQGQLDDERAQLAGALSEMQYPTTLRGPRN